MSKDKGKLYKREWLNGRGTGFIEIDFDFEDDYPYGNINIADCSRKISLNFDSGSASNKKRSIAKLNLMIRLLEKSRSFLEKSKE